MKKIEEIIGNSKSIGICGHVRPDGDSVGACLALYGYLRKNYPDLNVKVFLEDPPYKFRLLKGYEDICDLTVVSAPDIKFDLFIVLDAADIERIDLARPYFDNAGHTVCIDHHISDKGFADENYVFPDMSSASEALFRFLNYDLIDSNVASAIYLGIVHDTGVFQYSNTSSETMQIAAALVDKGIDQAKIINDSYYLKTYNQARIWGMALESSKLYLEEKVAVSVVTLDDMEKYGVRPKALDGISSELRTIRGVEAAVLIYETEKGVFKLSMRSGDNVDVAAIAGEFGGGGHVRAAGGSSQEDPEAIIKMIVGMVEKQLNGKL